MAVNVSHHSGRRRALLLAGVGGILLTAFSACNTPLPPGPSDPLIQQDVISLPPLAPASVVHVPEIVCAAGDLVHPATLEAGHAVATLAREIGCETILLLGDLVYERGDLPRFRGRFASVWGDLLSRIRPVLGNHEDPDAYYTYFGAAAGPSGLGYYSFDLGNWRIIALNSETPRSADQMTFLRSTLATKTSTCEIMFWHIPYFSGGPHGVDEKVRGFVSAGEEAGVELALTAHNHNYQRFAPMTAAGRPSPTGIRQIISGAGGAPLRALTDRAAPNLESSDSQTSGLLKLTLFDDSYSGEFVPILGQSFTDSFSGSCH